MFQNFYYDVNNIVENFFEPYKYLNIKLHRLVKGCDLSKYAVHHYHHYHYIQGKHGISSVYFSFPACLFGVAEQLLKLESPSIPISCN